MIQTCRSSCARLMARALCPMARCVALLLPIGLAGCAATSAPPPPQKPQILIAPAFARDWTTDLSLKTNPVTHLFVREGLLFAYTQNGTAYILKRDTGTVAHSEIIPGGAYRLRPPVVLKDYIVYPTTSELEVYGRKVGDHVRTYDLHASINANATGAVNSMFVAVTTQTGSRVQKYDLNQRVDIPSWQLQPYAGTVAGAPAVHSGVVYFATDAGKVYAVSAETREPIWPIADQVFDARASIVADIQADDSGLYIPTLLEGRLYVLNGITGHVKWQWTGSGGLTTPPTLTSDTVYQLDPNLGMIALNKVEALDVKEPQYNRKARWVRKDIVQILSQDDEHTYALRNDGVIVGLDKKTGQTIFTSRRKDLTIFATNTQDATIYASTPAGGVLAIKAVYQSGQMGVLVMSDPLSGQEAATVAMVPTRAASGPAFALRQQ